MNEKEQCAAADELSEVDSCGCACEAESFDFGIALRKMRQGERVCRAGWNGKGMYIFLADNVEFQTKADLQEFQHHGVTVHDVLVMRTATGDLQPAWLASQADMLACDWRVKETEIEGATTNPQVKLSAVAVGDVVKVGDHAFVVLEHRDEGTALILKELLCESEVFSDSNNNYAGSRVEEICNDFADTLAGIVGAENVILHDVDLTSDDGLKDYGIIKRRVSLLTADMYRKFVEFLDAYKPDTWWWLATPYSTARHEHTSWIKCVSPAGRIYFDGRNLSGRGVRPFCILNSEIFVSK